MFRNLAQLLAPRGRNDVFLIHPLQLSRWLDEALGVGEHSSRRSDIRPLRARHSSVTWTSLTYSICRAPVELTTTPRRLRRPASVSGPEAQNPNGFSVQNPDVFNNRGPSGIDRPPSRRPGWCGITWSTPTSSSRTGVYEVMAEVVRRLVVGETLNTLESAPSIKWLRVDRGVVLPGPTAVLDQRSGQRGAAQRPHQPAQRILAHVRPWICPTRSPARWAGSGWHR